MRTRRLAPKPLVARQAPPVPVVKPPSRPRPAVIPEAELMSVDQLIACLGISRSTIHRLKVTSTFPKPIKLSVRRVAYRTSEVRDWLAAQARAKGTGERAASMPRSRDQ